MSQKLRKGENLWLSYKICWKYGFICKNHEKCVSRVYLQKVMKNVKIWKLEDLFVKFNKKCEKLEIVDISAKNWKKEVYLKKWKVWGPICGSYENLQKNNKS